MTALRRIAFSAAALVLAACGPVPHPFAEHAPNPLVDDHRITATVIVRPVPRVPGLAERLAKALGDQDILASTGTATPGTLLVDGRVEKGALIWRLTGVDNRIIDEAPQPLRRGDLARINLAGTADHAAAIVAGLLRGNATQEAAPTALRVRLQRVKIPKGYDGDAFTKAMALALAGQGLIVTKDKAAATIDGVVRVLPGSANQNLVEVSWTVRSPDGTALGTVSQGSPVEHTLLTTGIATLARQVTDAAVPGVMEVIRKKLAPPAKSSRSGQRPNPS